MLLLQSVCHFSVRLRNLVKVVEIAAENENETILGRDLGIPVAAVRSEAGILVTPERGAGVEVEIVVTIDWRTNKVVGVSHLAH
jgi:hypothetical protein